MSMSIKTNVASLQAQRNLMNSENDLNKSLSKLSSGYRITKAQDDAAGLAIAVNLGAQIKSYNQAVRNANDALNVTQTAEASLNVGSSRVDLQACKLEYSIVSPK